MVVLRGDTVIDPGVATPPIPLSISTSLALVTGPQLNTDERPGGIADGFALKYEITGVPLQPTAVGAVVGLGTGVGVEVGGTLVGGLVGVKVGGTTVIVIERSTL
jgi:hypothetical protein